MSAASESAPTHQAIAYCPYCAEENLFPAETGWECRACLRAFSVTFHGLVARTGAGTSAPAGSATEQGTRR